MRIRFETVDSTNKYLMDHHADLPDFTVAEAAFQSAGRGRLGRVWHGDGKSALFSVLLKEHVTVANIGLVPFVAAAALHKAMKAHARRLRIKWPNDIISPEGKLAGILCESVIEDGAVRALVVGFGVNVNNVTFPDDIAAEASSLFLESGKAVDVSVFIDEVVAAFTTEWASFRDGASDFLSYCNRHSALKGERIFFLNNGVRMDGIAGTMRKDGSLSVKTKNGTVFLHSGEATISGGMKLPSE